MLTYSKSPCQVLARAYEALRLIVNLFAKNLFIRLQWMPSHIRLEGSETPDKLANKAISRSIEISCKHLAADVFPFATNLNMDLWSEVYNWKPWFVDSTFSQNTLVMSFRLDSGLMPSNKRYHIIKRAESPVCRCTRRVA